jgi:tol-pal system protein YbgF
MNKQFSIATAIAVAFLISAPVSAQSVDQRLEVLERRAALLSDMTLKLNALQEENRELRGTVETLQYELDQVKRKQRDLYLDVDDRLTRMSGGVSSAPVSPVTTLPTAAQPAPQAPVATLPSMSAVPPASAVTTLPGATALPAQLPAAAPNVVDPTTIKAAYDAAYQMISPSQRRYADAITAFNDFLVKYPESDLASNAQYWLAEAHYVSQQNAEALAAFNKVISSYPNSSKVPGALYKIGRLEYVAGNKDAAKVSLERLTKEFPQSAATGLAKQLLLRIARGE